jgi:hypothetical protein
MNKKSLLSYIVIPALLLVGAGCASSQLNPNLTVYDRDKVADRPISLPDSYNTENFRRLTLVIEPGDLKSNALSANNLNYMSLRMQSELAKLRRFSVFALHGSDSSRLQDLQDLGEIELVEATDLPKIDLLTSWNINLNAQSEQDGRETTITFVCNINVTCKDLKTGLVKFTKDIDPRVVRKQRRNRYGHVVEGFDYSNKTQLQAMLQDLATQAAIRIANELGNEYPVGGRITAALGADLMTLDKGSEQGIAKGMQMVVYANVGGVDVPLGNAEATPSINTSQLEMWRLNTSNKYAAKVLREIEDNPNWLTNNKLYAVGYGMAVPPEWQTKEFYLPE